jgi:hypothetical protein
MKKPFGTWTERAATASVPTTADAASGVAAPASRAVPAPTSTAALAIACAFGCRKPIDPNQRPVPSRLRPWRTPWAIIVPPTAARSARLATSLATTLVLLCHCSASGFHTYCHWLIVVW